MKRQTFYFESEKDNFTTIKLTPKKIDSKYIYIHKNIFYRFFSFIFYRVIATPLSYLFVKMKHNIKFENKKILKKFRKQGLFLYANHSMAHADPFIPTFAVFPKRNFIIVHPDNVSQFLVGRIMPMLGALPLPSDLKAYGNFINAIETRIKQNACITIYPEASIWPYYNSVREFPSTSFAYPVNLNVPVFCMTNTFQKKKFSKKVKVTTFIDGPFYPDLSLDKKSQKEDLKNKVFNCMKNRCDTYSTYSYNNFEKKIS
ncbi:MAG: hypothetical protein IJW82_08120 [Clostridia bacterium]|nr:hypothetical protein [Clostridia bacterium]